MDANERRVYQRTAFNCDAKVSADQKRWTPFEVRDLSSSGLQMAVDASFDQGARLWFDLVLYGLSTQFEAKVEGVVRRKSEVHGTYVYGVSFEGISPDLKIRIDETINHMRPKDFLI